MNRVVQAYLPALAVCYGCLALAYMNAFEHVIARDEDFWLFVLALTFLDVVLVFGHVYDDSLSVDVALNCRIVYVGVAGMITIAVLVFT